MLLLALLLALAVALAGAAGPVTRDVPAPAALAAQPYVAAYRCSVLLGTCAAILAVDFRVFPLRLAKTAVAGTSLMDLGAGSFAFAHGARARHGTPRARPLTRHRPGEP